MAEQRRRAHKAVTARFPLDEVHLADTSAWSKARNDERLADIFDGAVRSGLIATCDPIALQLLGSARDGDRFRVSERSSAS